MRNDDGCGGGELQKVAVLVHRDELLVLQRNLGRLEGVGAQPADLVEEAADRGPSSSPVARLGRAVDGEEQRALGVVAVGEQVLSAADGIAGGGSADDDADAGEAPATLGAGDFSLEMATGMAQRAVSSSAVLTLCVLFLS